MTTVYIVKWTQNIQQWRLYILLNEHRTQNVIMKKNAYTPTTKRKLFNFHNKNILTSMVNILITGNLSLICWCLNIWAFFSYQLPIYLKQQQFVHRHPCLQLNNFLHFNLFHSLIYILISISYNIIHFEANFLFKKYAVLINFSSEQRSTQME